MKRYARMAVVALALGLLSASPPADPWREPLENIYWGDLHVHTSYSVDAFLIGMTPGRWADEAGTYALYCGRLDFYAITDHANLITDPDYWEKAIASVRRFNQIGMDNPDENGDPSIVAFPGWEWTMNYIYGHKNVIFKYDDPERLVPAPFRCRSGIQGFPKAIRKMEIDADDGELSSYAQMLLFYAGLHGYAKGNNDTTFVAPTSGDLFSMLREHCVEAGTGCEALVIPHGTAWTMIPPAALTSWPAQLDPENHDPHVQRLIEVYSKHGNSEEYSHFPPMWRYFKNGEEVPPDQCLIEQAPDRLTRMSQNLGGGPNPTRLSPDCEKVCPRPTEAFVPCCWRAGEIVAGRCLDPESEFCKQQIELARSAVAPFPETLSKSDLEELKPEYRSDPAHAHETDWGACGQCRDCWQPAANYQNNGSVQRALAAAYFGEDGDPLYYRFGFIGSTDTHSSWPGSVKETKRMTEAMMNPGDESPTADYPGWGRVDNFLNPGGLAAVLAERRTRDELWDAMVEKNVYSSSGPRIEVWARAVVGGKVVRMGSESSSSTSPAFYLKAVGAPVEDDTCPYDDEPMIQDNLSREEFKRVCGNQCYRTTSERNKIARIEVVKILQPLTPEEAAMKDLERSPENPNGLIMDPYHVAEFNRVKVDWNWTDPAFTNEPGGRSVVYYFRIIQAPTPGYNCNPVALLNSGASCDLKDPGGAEIESRINPQDGEATETLIEIDDPCYSDPTEPKSFCQERAWTSPFYVIRR